MEFKFRAIDDRTTQCRSSSSPSFQSLSYFSEQALRGSVNYSMDSNFMHNPRDFYTIEREIEKERIRHEIITAENLRRRLLEEEVRRELIMEREMAMHRGREMGISIDERLLMQPHTRYALMHQFNSRSLEERFLFPGNRVMGFGHDVLPPTPLQLSDALKDEISLGVNQKDKLIMLAKPDPNLCGSKRKAATPPATSGEPPLNSSKRPEEWSCALCRVSATSEKGLNDHLQGKKHKAKEAGLLRAQKMCNNSSLSVSKKYKKKVKLTETGDSSGQEMKIDVEEESAKASKTVVCLDQKLEGAGDSENKNKELPQDTTVKSQKKTNGKLTAQNKRILPLKKKKFKFWCQDCEVGTHSAVVMESHKRGKKHLARLNESKNNDEALHVTTGMIAVAPSEPTEKAEDVDLVTKSSNEETTGGVTEKGQDEDLLPKALDAKTTGCIPEKAEDEEAVAKEAKDKLGINVIAESDGRGPSIVADVVDLIASSLMW